MLKLWSAGAWRDHQEEAECYCYFIISRQLSLSVSAPPEECLEKNTNISQHYTEKEELLGFKTRHFIIYPDCQFRNARSLITGLLDYFLNIKYWGFIHIYSHFIHI